MNRLQSVYICPDPCQVVFTRRDKNGIPIYPGNLRSPGLASRLRLQAALLPYSPQIHLDTEGPKLFYWFGGD